ncbi:MAG: 50S ribosomal protein L30 [Desulfomicrobium sp.]|nr:50S ribosomal protein L30 [Desulfomicrobium sp.]
MIKVKLVRSTIAQSPIHKKTVKALGFTKVNQVRELPDSASIRGMIVIVNHLVEVLDNELA